MSHLRIVHETVTAVASVPRIVSEELKLPPYPAPPIAEAEPQQQPDPVVHALNRPDTAAPIPPDTRTVPETRVESPLEPTSPPTPPADPPARTVIPNPEPVVLPSEPAEAPAPAGKEASNVRDESAAVRSTLRRYETAFNNLDAAAASAIWPAVNSGELARAFRGLASQSISLRACAVTVSGAAARAICSGSATWEPKVGGGVRTDDRRWNFDLRKSGESWRIERATAR